MSHVLVYKEVGETPLEALERYRAEQVAAGRVELVGVPMTYAGRLDPMAEGELLILIGEECKNKEKYLGLDKEYEVEIVFEIGTDTYDALGLAGAAMECFPQHIEVLDTKNVSKFKNGHENVSKMPIELERYVGKLHQEYPAYSSKTFKGKQLHELARADELPESNEMPTKEVEIYSIEELSQREISAETLKSEIFSMIDKVKGDFRQEQIKNRWAEVLAAENTFKAIKIRVNCSAGTYMRSLAHRIGQDSGCGAIALSIKRTRISL